MLMARYYAQLTFSERHAVSSAPGPAPPSGRDTSETLFQTVAALLTTPGNT